MLEAAGQDALSKLSDERNLNGNFNGPRRTGHRLSVASAETGESSGLNSFIVEKESEPFPVKDWDIRSGAVDSSGLARSSFQDARGSHRSHRSRGSGSFLVSNSIFEQHGGVTGGPRSPQEIPIQRRNDSRDTKGKLAVRSPEKKLKKNRYDIDVGTGGSPLTATFKIDALGRKAGDKSLAAADISKDQASHAFHEQNADTAAPKYLDVESAQIVNLALNLSESRRNVAKRNTPTHLITTLPGFGDGFAGGSLRQHLQMQRRVSRNVSPKPEKGVIAPPRMPPAQRMEGSIQIAVGTNRGADYKYQFSASTILRADKAKEAIELMVQYRRLLQYVPPLKPQSLKRNSTKSPPGSAIGSLAKSATPLYANGLVGKDCSQLGRPYNPLQYIRNRKVRARERKTIDGESQGFGNVERVASWIDKVSEISAQDDYQAYDRVQLPNFSLGHNTYAASLSQLPTPGKIQASSSKNKRPRVDWITNPADMLADIYWLEQDEHKRLIEDNRERKIFPQYVELSRSPGQEDEGPLVGQDLQAKDLDKKLRIETKLTSTFSTRTTMDHSLDTVRLRGRQKFHISQLSEDSHGIKNAPHISNSSHKSSSESSESDVRRSRPNFRRNATAGSNDLGADILEKQMLEILIKESNRHDWVVRQTDERKGVLKTYTSSSIGLHESVGEVEHEGTSNNRNVPTSAFRTEYHERANSRGRQELAIRRSLEGHDPGGRYSLDGLDSSAPNSPIVKESNDLGFVPSIAIDLSPAHSRKSSPTRHPALAKVKSKINSLQDRSRNHSRSNSVRSASRNPEEGKEKFKSVLEIPSTPDDSRRPVSPTSKVIHRKTEENVQSLKAGSLRRKAEELPAGIRGLFKTGRNPVQRLGDFIYRKEPQASSMASSNSSSDDSDQGDSKTTAVSRTTTFERSSKRSSRDVSSELSPLMEPKSYALPTFSSPIDRRRKSAALNDDTESPESDYISHRQRVRERRLSRFQMLQPPRIDIQSASPHSSPDIAPDRTGRDSDVSDLENHRMASLSVKKADARLNAILGMPGHSRAISGRDGFPVTGLTHLEDNNTREGLDSKRQWSISDCIVAPSHGPITKRDIARVRALLLSSGIKAKEITRRAAEMQDLDDTNKRSNTYTDIVALNREPQLLKPVPRFQAHILAARILSHDIQLSSQIWQESASNFSSQTVSGIIDRVEDLQDRLMGRNGLSEMTRQAEREADEVSRDLIEGKTLAVKELLERMDKMIRRRRRRFRWVRRAGWVALEWALVGVMWGMWLVFVLIRLVTGTIGAFMRAVRWLLWL